MEGDRPQVADNLAKRKAFCLRVKHKTILSFQSNDFKNFNASVLTFISFILIHINFLMIRPKLIDTVAYLFNKNISYNRVYPLPILIMRTISFIVRHINNNNNTDIRII